MARSRLRAAAAIVVIVAALLAAASGAAGTVVPSLHLKLTLVGTAKGSKTQTCQAGTRDRKAVARRSTIVGDAHRIAVVACEQPPKSEPVIPSALSHSVSGAFAAEG